jgi:hypothetical protein
MHRILVRVGVSLVALGLLLTVGARRADAGASVDPSGIYHGFFQSSVTPGRWGLLEFAISETRNRRWTGMVTMLIGGAVRVPFSVDGTLSASGEFTGVGKSPAGMVQFHGQFMFLEGGAALADATYQFHPANIGGVPPPDADRGTSQLLRDFIVGPDAPPNVNGQWDGTFQSAGTGGSGFFMLDVKQGCDARTVGDAAPRPSVSFVGTEIINGNQDDPFFFRGSINGPGSFAVIGWSLMNERFVVIGTAHYPPDPGKPGTATANYVFVDAAGMTDRGTFDMSQTTVGSCGVPTNGQ